MSRLGYSHHVQRTEFAACVCSRLSSQYNFQLYDDGNFTARYFVLYSTVVQRNLSPNLLGIYTTVYLATLFIYRQSNTRNPCFTQQILSRLLSVTRKSSRNNWVLGAITVIYLANIAQIASQWVIVNELLSRTGQPKGETFLFAASATGSGWDVLLDDIISLVISGLSDAPLVREVVTPI